MTIFPPCHVADVPRIILLYVLGEGIQPLGLNICNMPVSDITHSLSLSWGQITYVANSMTFHVQTRYVQRKLLPQLTVEVATSILERS